MTKKARRTGLCKKAVKGIGEGEAARFSWSGEKKKRISLVGEGAVFVNGRGHLSCITEQGRKKNLA